MLARNLFPAVIIVALSSSCFYLLSSSGGGETRADELRPADPADVSVPEGYRVEVIARGLTYPTAAAFDDEGRLHVVEAGYSYGPDRVTPRLLRVEADGSTKTVARGQQGRGPWIGALFVDGAFFVTEGAIDGGRILRVSPAGEVRVLVDGLPGKGDHHTNLLALGPDGMMYFGQGTATNSGVVGIDNHEFGWLERRPGYHDIPCEDVELHGQRFATENPLTKAEDDVAVTSPFRPFGVTAEPGEVVRGQVPCTGAVMRVAPQGGPVELVAWGFRNPYGVAFSPDGRLFVTDNGYDERGSRPVFGTPDLLWEAVPGAWHGWPDFSGGRPVALPSFDRLGTPAPEPLLARLPNEPPEAAAYFGVHSSSNGIAFSRSEAFGHVGEAFVAQFGDMAPDVGKILEPVGFRVVRVNVDTGVITPFAVNPQGPGPASKLGSGGLERPVDVTLSPDGGTLYVVDFGVMTIGKGAEPLRNTGVVWAIQGPGARVASGAR